jgi:hypothetical protein
VGLLAYQGGAKWFAVLVRPNDVRLISLTGRWRPTGIGTAGAHLLPWPCPGGQCCVRGSRLPGDGACRSAGSVRWCPSGVTVPPVTARVLRRGLR